MFALLIIVVVAVPALYATDRILKARARARRLRAMSDRLDAATARAEQQHERQQEAAKASGALTSVMPAINRPPLTLPDEHPHTEHPHTEHPHTEHRREHGAARSLPGCGRAEHDHPHSKRPSAPASTQPRSAGRRSRR